MTHPSLPADDPRLAAAAGALAEMLSLSPAQAVTLARPLLARVDAAAARSDDGPAPLRVVRHDALDAGTAQTPGMARWSGVSAATAGSRGLWLGETRMAPGAVSGDHHHGATETAIHVVAGSPVFVDLSGPQEVRHPTGPGDYVYVPPFTPHREENPGDVDAMVVIARTSDEAVVVNL